MKQDQVCQPPSGPQNLLSPLSRCAWIWVGEGSDRTGIIKQEPKQNGKPIPETGTREERADR